LCGISGRERGVGEDKGTDHRRGSLQAVREAPDRAPPPLALALAGRPRPLPCPSRGIARGWRGWGAGWEAVRAGPTPAREGRGGLEVKERLTLLTRLSKSRVALTF
jgi:hypothetical protein